MCINDLLCVCVLIQWDAIHLLTAIAEDKAMFLLIIFLLEYKSMLSSLSIYHCIFLTDCILLSNSPLSLFSLILRFVKLFECIL